MVRISLFSLAVVFLLGSTPSTQITPTLTIINQASQDATVKTVGPTAVLIDVESQGRRRFAIAGGVYTLKIRYCDTSACRYTQTGSFSVTQTSSQVSHTTVTLHSAGGNLGERPIAPTDF